MVVLLLAISAHEAAHAWMSYKFGDDTAYLLGRITLNPVAHTHPIGTLVIPIMMFILAHINSPLAAIPLIGWGKPTALAQQGRREHHGVNRRNSREPVVGPDCFCDLKDHFDDRCGLSSLGVDAGTNHAVPVSNVDHERFSRGL